MKRPLTIFTALALSPLFGYAQSANVVAGLQQDVSALRDEVRKLRAEVEDMRETQARIESAQRTKPASAPGDTGAVNARIAAVETASANARRADKAELLAEVNQKVSALESRVNRALAEQTSQVNAALRTGATVKPAEPVAAPKPPESPAKATDIPADMPKSGVKYTVRPGDSVPRIAKKLNSKPEWVLAANGLRSNADLKAHAVLFIPQAEEAPAKE